MSAYLAAVVAARRRGRWWPPWRAACWFAGIGAVAVALRDDTDHVVGHLLLGMAAPILLVLGAPVTLLLRALPVRAARVVSRLLTAGPVRFVTHPVTAAVLNTGGMWVLYTTGLHHATGWVRVLVTVHVLAAGYLFTAAMIGSDPAPHRAGRTLRAVVLVASAAAHAILAKHLYGTVLTPAGARLMYYGGDVLEIALMVIFWAQWYAGRTRVAVTAPPRAPWRLPANI